MHTGEDVSDGNFSVVGREVPEIIILEPQEGQHYKRGDELQLKAVVLDVDGRYVPENNMFWSAGYLTLGEGSSLVVTNLPDPAYGYNDVGVYLQARSSVSGNWASKRIGVVLEDNAQPQVILDPQEPNVAVGTPLKFNAYVDDTDGTIDHLLWDFDGDDHFEQTNANTTVTNTFSTTGAYHVVCRAIDNAGATGEGSATIRVTPSVEVRGFVRRGGVGIPGVEIQLNGSVIRNVVTGPTGEFVFPDLPQFEYSLSCLGTNLNLSASPRILYLEGPISDINFEADPLRTRVANHAPFAIEWVGISSATYRVEASTNLTGNWQTVYETDNATFNGEMMHIELNHDAPHQFYRIQETLGQ
jgi:plastocyanin